MGIKQFFVGKKIFQPFFERLHRISLRGMNYGLGGMTETSGEVFLLKMLTTHLYNMSDTPVIFDVGANKGQYLSQVLKIYQERASIHSFEPSLTTHEVLKSNFKQYKNVYTYPFGLGDIEEERMLYFDEEGTGWASLFPRNVEENQKALDETEQINIRRIESFCREMEIEKIHFTKMDIEGFELEALKGAGNYLGESMPFIQFEFSYANYDSRTFMKDFFECLEEYTIYRILQDGVRKISYDPKYEIYMTTNFLAVHKSIKI